MGVSKNRGTPKWMVYNGSKPYEQMDDLGVPLFLETPKYIHSEHWDFVRERVLEGVRYGVRIDWGLRF